MLILEIEITRVDVRSKETSRMSDFVAEEKPLCIFINKKPYATIFCSPSNLKEMTVGHLISEGIAKSVREIDEVSVKASEAVCKVKLKSNISLERRKKLLESSYRIIRSACGSSLPYQLLGKFPQVKSPLAIKAEMILDCVNQLNFNAEIFRKTGGVHVAAIYTNEGIAEAFAEDVGRYNAVDKAIGIGALKDTDFTKCFLAVSGRLTGDMVLKAARAGLPIVASLGAALDSGIAVAKKAGLTLIGFARGNRMNIYTFPERILW